MLSDDIGFGINLITVTYAAVRGLLPAFSGLVGRELWGGERLDLVR